jgi:hypothetical protein
MKNEGKVMQNAESRMQNERRVNNAPLFVFRSRLQTRNKPFGEERKKGRKEGFSPLSSFLPFPSLFFILHSAFCTLHFAFCILLAWSPPAYSQHTDPLGNPVFDKSGKELYKIQATYGVLGGSSLLRRDEEFRKKTSNRNFFTFNIPGDNVRHQITVGNFPTKFSSFTLNKELFDAGRWNITVPKARGRVSTFVARVTNNTFSVSGERSSPIENRDIVSGSDWFMAGLRAEANLGAYGVRLGTLPTFTLPLPRLGINFVNRFFTNYDLSRAANPFRGATIANPPSELFLRFSDASPENAGGAKVFRTRVFVDDVLEYDIVGGKEPPGVLRLSGESNRDERSRWVDGEGVFVYQFSLFNPQDINSVRFEVDIANDYQVELSTDNENFQLMLNAPGNVSDESNRGVHEFFYGELTDETTMGFDLQTTLLGFSIEAEWAWYAQTRQYPLLSGRRTQRSARAWFIDVNRNFGPITWRSEYTRINPFFSAANFIDDNDDEDAYADSREPEILISGNTKDDLDGDRIKDWDDDFLLFFADPPKFRLGLNRESIDFNNNGEPDNLEDDDQPNYRFDYDEGSYGHHTYLKIELPFAEGLSVLPGYYTKHLILEHKSARGFYNIFEFAPESIPHFGNNHPIVFRYTLRRSRDIIPDDVVIRSTGERIEDNLALQDYLGNIFTMIVDYQNIKNLTIRSKFKYQRDALFHTRQRVIDTAFINQIRYDYSVSDDLTIAPAFRSDRTIGYTIPFDKRTAVDVIRNAYILTLTHRAAAQLQLSAGGQYLTWRDLNDPEQNFNRTVGFLEMVLQGDAFGQKMGLLATFDYVIHNFLEPIGGGERRTNISITLFLL